MKKLSLILLSLILALALSACGADCEHTYDNNCDSTCNACGEERAVPAHTATDDGDCTTPVKCEVCENTVTEARAHSFAGAYHSDADGHWQMCTNDGCAVAGVKEEHSALDDDDCETADLCNLCDYPVVEAAPHRAEADDGDCTTPVMCTECSSEVVAATAEHTDYVRDRLCDTEGCEYEFHYVPVINEIELYGENVTREGNVYTVTVPQDLFYVKVGIRVVGENLDIIVEDRLSTYQVRLGEDNPFYVNAAMLVESASAIYRDDFAAVYYNSVGMNTIYVSSDDGATWTATEYSINVVMGEASDPVPTDTLVTGVEFYGNGVVRDGNAYTITMPEGESIFNIKTRVTGENVDRIVEDYLSGHMLMIGEASYAINAAFEIESESSICDDAAVAIIVGEHQLGENKVYLSNDGGETWVDAGITVTIIRAEQEI